MELLTYFDMGERYGGDAYEVRKRSKGERARSRKSRSKSWARLGADAATTPSTSQTLGQNKESPRSTAALLLRPFMRLLRSSHHSSRLFPPSGHIIGARPAAHRLHSWSSSICTLAVSSTSLDKTAISNSPSLTSVDQPAVVGRPLFARRFSAVQCRREMHNAAVGNSHGHVVQSTHKIELPSEDRPLAEICELLSVKLQAFLDEPPESELLKGVQDQVRTSIKVAEEALDRYSLAEISLSYNGGKDCLVMLIIYLAALHSHYQRPLSTTSTKAANHNAPFPTSLPSIYIQPSHPFSEVDDFVQSSSRQYHLSLASSTLPMKAAFTEYLESHPQIKAIFVGTRRTDPHGGQLTHFDPTDGGWPSFMRIHPVINWHYQEIWAFIKHFDIPYCELYDKGYTSLGGTQDTLPNPRLANAGGCYRPAFELVADDEERLGRDVLISLDPASKHHNS